LVMEFKIDTKDSFTTIIPVQSVLNAKMADELADQCRKIRQSGSKNLIVDLQHCLDADKDGVNGMVHLHEESYSVDQSLVFTGLNAKLIKELKKDETDLLINVAPSMVEAIDIISMEVLERDLLSEE